MGGGFCFSPFTLPLKNRDISCKRVTDQSLVCPKLLSENHDQNWTFNKPISKVLSHLSQRIFIFSHPYCKYNNFSISHLHT